MWQMQHFSDPEIPFIVPDWWSSFPKLKKKTQVDVQISSFKDDQSRKSKSYNIWLFQRSILAQWNGFKVARLSFPYAGPVTLVITRPAWRMIVIDQGIKLTVKKRKEKKKRKKEKKKNFKKRSFYDVRFFRGRTASISLMLLGRGCSLCIVPKWSKSLTG